MALINIHYLYNIVSQSPIIIRQLSTMDFTFSENKRENSRSIYSKEFSKKLQISRGFQAPLKVRNPFK